MNLHFRSVPMSVIDGSKNEASVSSITSNLNTNTNLNHNPSNNSQVTSVDSSYVEVDTRNMWSFERPVKMYADGRHFNGVKLTRPTGTPVHFHKGDPVWLKNTDGLTWVACILKIYFDPSRIGREQKRVVLRWLFSVEDLRVNCPDEPLSQFEKNEFSFSDDLDHDDNSLDIIQGRAILCQTEAQLESSTPMPHQRCFLVRNFYSPGPRPFLRPLVPNELRYLLAHVDDKPMIHRFRESLVVRNYYENDSTHHASNTHHARNTHRASNTRNSYKPPSPITKQRNPRNRQVLRDVTKSHVNSTRRDSNYNESKASQVYRDHLSGKTLQQIPPTY